MSYFGASEKYFSPYSERFVRIFIFYHFRLQILQKLIQGLTHVALLFEGRISVVLICRRRYAKLNSNFIRSAPALVKMKKNRKQRRRLRSPVLDTLCHIIERARNLRP